MPSLPTVTDFFSSSTRMSIVLPHEPSQTTLSQISALKSSAVSNSNTQPPYSSSGCLPCGGTPLPSGMTRIVSSGAPVSCAFSIGAVISVAAEALRTFNSSLSEGVNDFSSTGSAGLVASGCAAGAAASAGLTAGSAAGSAGLAAGAASAAGLTVGASASGSASVLRQATAATSTPSTRPM